MSDDQLDDDLRDRIKQVFDNYQDDTAEEGWLLLREKYPEKERRRIVPLYWRYAGIAALLLAVLGIGLWLNFHPAVKPTGLVIKRVKPNNTVTPVLASGKNNNNPENAPLKSSTPLVVKTNQNFPAVKPAIGRQKNNKLNPSNTVAVTGPTGGLTSTKYNHVQNTGSNGLPVVAGLTRQNPNVKNTVVNNTEHLADSTRATVATTQKASVSPVEPADNNNIINTTSNTVATTTKPQQSTPSVVLQTKPAQKSIESYLEQDDKYRAAQNADAPKVKYKTVSFSIYAATYVNYAKGSANQVNAGAGFTTDIKLTDNLSISTGVAIAQNTLSYNNGIATDAPAVFNTAASLNYIPQTNQLSEITPVSRNLNANLVDLDIPVNLKYVFDPEKNNTYFAAGLSSGTFLNETYNYTYNYTTPNNPAMQQSQQTSTHNTFDNFYFAKMLNLSFGMGYNIGKTKLIIEPFFKYPLTGLGDQHILFGSGGLNLKINLDPPKKHD